MDIREYIKSNVLFLDGGMGTLLQEKGLSAGEHPERWNLLHPEIIKEIHKSYYDAGSNVVCTNTFGANILKFSARELSEIVKAAVLNAKAAREESVNKGEKFVALDVGPTGRLLRPYGDLDFEEAVGVFAETIKLGAQFGADLIFIETMNDSYETKAALLAAKENCELPVFVSNSYSEDGKLMTGSEPAAMVAMLEGMGADAIGVNCSLGPKQLAGIVDEYLENASVPVFVKANAGMPKNEGGKTVYDISADEFAEATAAMVRSGAHGAGGCCGTNPEYIRKLVQKLRRVSAKIIEKKNISCVSSYTHAVKFGAAPVLIGERINPTGKKLLKEALRSRDIDYVLQEGFKQQDRGVHILDVNVGLPEIDETEMMKRVTAELQAVIDLPLQIDTSDFKAMEAALRRYNGKAMVNSVNGKSESMDAVFPLVKKYGGLVVALTLDENGIPEKAEDRVEIAKRIIERAEQYGIEKKDLIFDPLCLAVSAERGAAKETLKAVEMISKELGALTSLGVSNVSFGLPQRDIINSAFFASALERGLSAAIMNPHSADMMKIYRAYRALHDMDENFEEYIAFAENSPQNTEKTAAAVNKTEAVIEGDSELKRAIIKGLKERAGELTEELLKNAQPLDIVHNEIIPALDIVGKGFEEKTVYLPQLLMSAEAAKSAFEGIKAAMVSKKSSGSAGECKVVIATVEGDIHDIGKNIVKLLLENYGFDVTDLGKDVPAREIVAAAKNLNAEVVGLSALMTTTVVSMEETIKLLRKELPSCKVVVGGAALTQEYADSIGADKYAKDAMDTVRYVQSMNEGKRSKSN